jgi:hypothetical protein
MFPKRGTPDNILATEYKRIKKQAIYASIKTVQLNDLSKVTEEVGIF